MKTLLLTTALAVTLISPAFAGEKTITVPIPKSITIVCSDDVKRGTVVLSNPPKFSCVDYETIKSVIGTGITIGPDTRINQIAIAIKRATRSNYIASVTRQGNTERYKMKSGNTVIWKDAGNGPMDEYDNVPRYRRSNPKSENVAAWERDYKRRIEELRRRRILAELEWAQDPMNPDNIFRGMYRNRKYYRD